MTVDVLCRPGCRCVPLRLVRETARKVLQSAGAGATEVSILLTGDSEIRSLNRRYRRIDSATDVLSFPGEDASPGESHLGDVVISVESAARYARKARWPVSQEIRFLVIHGILHLLGQDHERDRGEMDRAQARIARNLLGRDVPRVRLSPEDPRPGRRRGARPAGPSR